MQDWRAGQRIDALREAAKRAGRRPAAGSFAADVETYLKAVATMPSFVMRKADLEAWIAVFGRDANGRPRTRASITPDEIRAALQTWRLQGKRRWAHVFDWKTRKPLRVEIGRTPLSESALNHRRTALMHLFTVLDGKSAANPVREVPRFHEPDPAPRGVPLDVVRAILAAMPDSATKARCRVMAFTGLPHATLMRLTAADVNWDAATVYVPRRRKGKGTKARTLPLLPDALDAFRSLQQWEAWGPFSRDSLRRSLHRACDAINVPRIRPYDLRHSFATAAYQARGDIRAVQALLDHSDQRLTNRYTLGAVDAQMRAVLDAMAGRKVTASVTTRRKSQRSARR